MHLDDAIPDIPTSRCFSWKIVLIALAVIVLVSVVLHYQVRAYVIREANTDIENMLLQHKGVHQYVQQDGHRELYALKAKGKLPAELYSPALFSSSYMVRNMHEHYNDEREKMGRPKLYYKLAAHNPRNPANKADEFETELIEMFNKNPDMKEYRDVVSIDGEDHLYVATPFLKTEERCLRCHGDREASPADLQELYPGEGGFNEEVGKIRAIESLRAPLGGSDMAIAYIVLVVAGIVGSGMLALLLLNTRLRRMVATRTARIKRQAEELTTSESRLRSALSAGNLGTWRWDAAAKETWLDENYQGLLGVDSTSAPKNADEFIRQCVHPEDRESVRLRLHEVITGREAVSCEYRIVRPDGTIRWLRDRGKPLFGESGEIACVTGTVADITESKRAEKELVRLRNYLSNIIDSMPSILVGVDVSGCVTLWNLHAQRATEISPDDAIGRPLREVLPQLAGEIDQISLAIHNNEVLAKKKRTVENNGQVHHEEITICPLVANGIEGAVIRVDDVTREHMLQEQLHQSQKMDAIGQLAGGVAHDFNNMLNGILGAAQLLETKLPGDNKQAHTFLEMIIESARRAADLTGNLLTFSRKGQIESTSVSVHDAITSAMALLERSLDKRIDVTVDLAATKNSVIGDLSQLQNVFLNLGLNAGHAMPAGGLLIVRTAVVELDKDDCTASSFDIKPGEYIQIDVIDTGCGIRPENLSRIFEPFFTTRSTGKGTGLGLSAVFGTVQQHRGAVTVESEMGRGTVFHVYMPLAANRISLATPVAETPIPGTGRILVVDDESVIRATAKALLEDLGYDVLVAEDGVRGMDVFRREHENLDAVVLDMVMPEMGGRDCFAAMKAFDPDVPVILASGFSREEDIKSLKKQGLAGFLRKPYCSTELSRVIAEVITARELVGAKS